MKGLRDLFRSPPRPQRPGYRPQFEVLEGRSLPAIGPFETITSVQIIAVHNNLRLAPGTPLQLVLLVTGVNSAGQVITLENTADQLALQLGSVPGSGLIQFEAIGGHRNIFTNSPDFTALGKVNVQRGSSGLGEGIIAFVDGVPSQPLQIVRDNSVNNTHTFDGSYGNGTTQGTFQVPDFGLSGPAPVLQVHFRINGRTITVDQPGAFVGGISPNFTGEFAFGNGGFPFSITVAGFTVSGTATFHIGLTKLSTFAVLCGGNWNFTGSLPDGTVVTAQGSWNAQFLG